MARGGEEGVVSGDGGACRPQRVQTIRPRSHGVEDAESERLVSGSVVTRTVPAMSGLKIPAANPMLSMVSAIPRTNG